MYSVLTRRFLKSPFVSVLFSIHVTHTYLFLLCAYARIYGIVLGTCDSKHNFDMVATFSTKYIRHAGMSVCLQVVARVRVILLFKW